MWDFKNTKAEAFARRRRSSYRLLRYPRQMPIPDYQTCMLPLLQYLSDGAEHSLRDAEESLGEYFKLSPAERAELLPSGQQGVFKNRIAWARTYLKKAALLESPKRAVFKITERGAKVLASNPAKIDIKYLEQFPEFIEFRDASKPEISAAAAVEMPQTKTTPEEAIELAHQGLREQLAAELLTRILGCSPTFFEQLVVELLVKMGYGGGRGATQASGSVKRGMAASTASSKRTGSDWTRSSSRQSAGRDRLDDPKFRNSSGLCRASERRRACSSQHQAIQPMLRITPLVSTPKWSSLTASNLQD